VSPLFVRWVGRWAVRVACCAPGVVLALADTRAEDRHRLQAERQALVQRFADEERACASRFVVTSCQDEVRARRREALAPLRERELKLDEAERRERAEQRRQVIAAKQAAIASAPARTPVSPPELRVRPPVTSASSASAALRTARPGDDGRAAEAAARAQAAQLRRQESQAAQERVNRREAERQAGRHRSQPLPVPASGPAR
jgi:colicin import membrane protein